MGLFGKSKGADPKEQVDKEQIVFGCIIIQGVFFNWAYPLDWATQKMLRLAPP